MNAEVHVQPQDALLAIERLLRFALHKRLLQPEDAQYARNLLLDLFQFDAPASEELPAEEPVPEEARHLLEELIAYGYSIGLIPELTTTYADLLDAKVMGLLIARPSEVIRDFHAKRQAEGIAAATSAFYDLCIDSNYIRMDRIRKNSYWLHASAYGNIEMTINLSKPEKNPKEIALATQMAPSNYPKCLLCADNVGYAGRVNHPARQNLRTIPVELNGQPWHFQYSPYVYYNEHCIVFSSRHEPMKLTHETFERLVDFVEQFPHYFVGTNADLPIVGGSILTHDHFQGGRHTFPIEKTPMEAQFTHERFPEVTIYRVKWPMSVLRLRSSNRAALLQVANGIYDAWKLYSDVNADIYAFSESNGVRLPHNTVTPIVRIRDNGEYEMDLVLRNNRCNDEHPEGIFHPHRHLHHIKKENIGLIEVMGVAILPGRLKQQFEQIGGILSGKTPWDAEYGARHLPHLAEHAVWIQALLDKYGASQPEHEVMGILEREVGDKFVEILSDSGVYKRNEQGLLAFNQFVQSMGWKEVCES